MAHARNIKPGLYKNEDLAECTIWARHMFALLPMVADREGRLEDRPKRLKGELFAYDSIDVEPLLGELELYGFIDRYAVNGRRYIQIVKFLEHQRPHGTEKDSVIPDRDGFFTVHERGKNGCSTNVFNKLKSNHGDLTVNQTLDNALIHRFTDSLIHKPGGEQQRSASTVGGKPHTQTQNPQPEPIAEPDQAPADGMETPSAGWGEPPAEPESGPSVGTETPPSGKTAPASESDADAITVRAVDIAVLLRQRGAGVAAGDVRLRDWAQRGITDAALLTALETAERRRQDAKSPQPVNAGLLDSILADAPSPNAASPPARDSPRNGKQAAREGYMAQARKAGERLGIDAGEHHGRIEHDITGSATVVA